jgi:quinol monooxygenase YgiN
MILLTVRGTLVPKNLETARVLHNETAGSQRGIAAARALGDLSHNVFAPTDAEGQSAKAGELLFLDRWVDPQGIGTFFSNPHVQEQAANLWANKDASVWMPATGSFSYSLPAPRSKTARFVGIVRGPIQSPDKSIATFAKVDEAALKEARRRGLMSHEIFIRMGRPDEPLELLGLDLWCDPEGMREHYADETHMAALGTAFSGRPDASAWYEPAGDWSEW